MDLRRHLVELGDGQRDVGSDERVGGRGAERRVARELLAPPVAADEDVVAGVVGRVEADAHVLASAWMWSCVGPVNIPPSSV